MTSISTENNLFLVIVAESLEQTRISLSTSEWMTSKQETATAR